jgi:hypothetical protein
MKNCLYCNKEFEDYHNHKKFCCHLCEQRAFIDKHRTNICECGCGQLCNDKRQYCQGHASKILEKNNFHTHIKYGKEAYHWKGGKRLVGGYIINHVLSHPNRTQQGGVAKHRLVMEKKIGRYLTKKEIVHHIDGNVFNNKINNLYLFKSNSEHTIYHYRLRKIVNELIRTAQKRGEVS